MKTLAVFAALGLAVAGCRTTSSRTVAAPPPSPAAPSAAESQASRGEQAASATPAGSSPVAAGDAQSKALAWGQELTSLFYKGVTAPIWVRMTDEMKKGFKGEETLGVLKQQMDAQLGPESTVLEEKVIQSGGYQVYLRTATFPKWDKPINVIWSLDSEGRVAGFFIKAVEAGK
jgi:hypothetical protein